MLNSIGFMKQSDKKSLVVYYEIDKTPANAAKIKQIVTLLKMLESVSS